MEKWEGPDPVRFRKGTTPMDSNFIDYYREGDDILCHEWGMGGELIYVVKEIPEEIEGMTKEEE